MNSAEQNKRDPENWKKAVTKGRYETQFYPSKLRLERLTKKLTLDSVAASLGVSLTTYSAIEKGSRAVKETRALEISNLIGMALPFLFEKDDNGKYTAANGNK